MTNTNERKDTGSREAKTKTTPGYLEVAIISLISACIVVFAYNRYLAPKAMVVDLKGYVRTQKALLAAGELDDAGFKEKMDSFDRQVNSYVAEHPGELIILKSVVIRSPHERIVTIEK